jgi:hypothetical protein
MNIKNLIPYLVVFFSATFILSSCKNDVDVIGEWKEIPVVYAVFSPIQDTFNGQPLNYFRIEKAFLDPNTSALQIAQRPDSLYYGVNDLEVVLYEKFVTETNYRRIDSLICVDAASLGVTRDSGIFASSPNYIYVFDGPVFMNNQDRFYKLVINNKVNGKTYTQYCRGITAGNFSPSDGTFSNFSFTLPTAPRVGQDNRPINWANRNPVTTSPNPWLLNPVTFNWSQPTNAAIYDLSLIFKYAEFQVDANEQEIPGTRVNKEITWKAARNRFGQGETRLTSPFQNEENFYYFIKSPGGSVATDLFGENFFTFLASNLSDVRNTNIRRCAPRFDAIDARIDAGGPELAEYIRANNSNQSLIGGLFPADPFTNIQDGFGVFSYKFHIYRRNYDVGDETFEYLYEGDITRNLGFSRSYCN